jgi:hypothetical protein
MELTWDRCRLGMHRATADGITVAQVAQVIGPGGTDCGWMVWLHGRPDAFPDRYPTMEDAMRVVEANILDPLGGLDDVTPEP